MSFDFDHRPAIDFDYSAGRPLLHQDYRGPGRSMLAEYFPTRNARPQTGMVVHPSVMVSAYPYDVAAVMAWMMSVATDARSDVTAYAQVEDAARRCPGRQQEQKTQNRRQT